MGNRLSKIVTRTGDAGTTGLADGLRVAKHSPRIHALGEVDELNCALGVLRAEPIPEAISTLLADIQHALFDLGGEIALPGRPILKEEQVVALETAVETFNEELGPLKEFILPGGTRAASLAHTARAICRRTERQMIALAENTADAGTVSEISRRYLNRLSDLLFVLGRVFNKVEGQPDILWRHKRD